MTRSPELSRPTDGRMAALRVAVPLAVVAAGVIVIAAGLAALGGALIGVGVVVAVVGAVVRLGLGSEADREREEEARRHYARTGRWPAA